MKLPVAMARGRGLYLRCPDRVNARIARPAFTLVEVLIATAITLLLMAGIVTLFGSVSESVSQGQAMMETGDRLRATQHRLQTDLKYTTAPMLPRLDPREGKGYFTIVEGPGAYDPNYPAVTGIEPTNTENGGLDTTVADNDDFLMFTARSYGEPFVGRWDLTRDGIDNDGDGSTDEPDEGNAIQSQVAEICWFMRGTTLYRRVLLVIPERTIPTAFYNGMYYFADVSAHQEGGNGEPNLNWGAQRLVTNSLGDLTKRENRYAHWPRHSGNALQGFPHDVRMWGQLGLPTLRESSDPTWPFPLFGNAPTLPAPAVAPVNQNDFWVTPHPWANVELETGTMNAYLGRRNPERVTEDVIQSNVLGFDVKVWDPLAPVLWSSGGVIVEPGDPGYRLALTAALPAINNWINVDKRRTDRMPAQVVRLGAYVDLYYTRGIANAAGISSFSHAGDLRSGLQAIPAGAALWDIYPSHYEHDGVDQDADGIFDEWTDGLDNDPTVNRTLNRLSGAMVIESNLPVPPAGPGVNGGVDDDQELETVPPYPEPIRSIQIKIRVFERDSRQIREVTVTQDFVP